MRFLVAVSLILATASPMHAYRVPSTGSGALAKDFQDIVDLIPFDDVIDLSKAYLERDRQFQAVMDIMRSTEMTEFIRQLEATPEFNELLNYIQSNGLDIYYLMGKLNESLGLPPLAPLTSSDRKISGGFKGYFHDLVDIVPAKAITDEMNKKWDNSKVFADFINFLLQQRFVDFYDSLSNNEHLTILRERAVQFGIDENDFYQFYPLLLVVSVVIM